MIEIRNLSVRYGQGADAVAALSGIDLTIGPGEFVVALGASGCGKTTLLSAIAGFLAPTEGRILLDGAPVRGPGAERGVVFQRHALMPWLDVAENVAFGPKMRGVPRAERRRIALATLDLVGLPDCADRKVYELSGGGFRRECPSCSAHHFPRVDPVVIMLVRRGDTCLLGRGPHFRPHMYSCLAGFLEPGETIEDAVRREVFEETQIRVGAVTYRTSQPWPFPSSLMMGCAAEALDEVIVTDPSELEDARWFSRADVAAMLAGTHPEGILAPPPMAIANYLMRAFVAGET